tara:strand:+ start:3056 stop:3364 length:309 start_codon:yes stop_codon:yes gene_type:complete
MIKLTDSAKEHLKTLLKENNKKYVRLQVKGGGCAGFEYQWTFEDEAEEEDVIVEDIVVIDEINEGYINGLEVDWRKEIFGSNFEFNNPVAKSSCGCGTSFAV